LFSGVVAIVVVVLVLAFCGWGGVDVVQRSRTSTKGDDEDD
jgi:hypothetical protein